MNGILIIECRGVAYSWMHVLGIYGYGRRLQVVAVKNANDDVDSWSFESPFKMTWCRFSGDESDAPC